MAYPILLAAMLLASPQTTVPAGAAVATTTTTTTAAAPRTYRGVTVRPTTRVCVRTERTGSFIPARVCRSYSRWLSDGVDPLTGRSDR